MGNIGKRLLGTFLASGLVLGTIAYPVYGEITELNSEQSKVDDISELRINRLKEKEHNA